VIQLAVLSATKNPSKFFLARRLPVTVGRNSTCDLRLEEDGVWDQHVRIQIVPPDRIGLESGAGAYTAINGQPVQEAVLRNGDLIDIGCVQLRFGLSPVRQHGLTFREALTWAGLIGLCLSQIALIYTFLLNA
jgi:pSer/pThr/pTyr-binding forkhead associated (FHA) protein